jgi:glycosyltransferase involved in cell wall biosynthesis
MTEQADRKEREIPDSARRASIMIVLPGLSAGGSEHVVKLIGNHWAEAGFKVMILTLEPPGTSPYYSFDHRIEFLRIGMPPRRASKIQSALLVAGRVRRMRQAMRSRRPDIVLSFLTRTNVMTLLAASGLSRPVIVSERNNPAVQPFGRAWGWLRDCLYPRAFGLVAMTEGAINHFPERMRRRSWVIPNAIDLPAAWTRRRGGNILVAVGRLTHQKGFDLLLDAFARIWADVPEWRLIIWGEGEDRPRLERQRAELGLEGKVEFPGLTAKPGLWVETADLFVLSSRYEGWGIVLLEAMAAGLPVVSFNCEWGPASMIMHPDDGLLVPPGDVDALAAALKTVMVDAGLRQRLGERAAVSALRYLPDVILAQWDAVLATALADRSRGRDA